MSEFKIEGGKPSKYNIWLAKEHRAKPSVLNFRPCAQLIAEDHSAGMITSSRHTAGFTDPFAGKLSGFTRSSVRGAGSTKLSRQAGGVNSSRKAIESMKTLRRVGGCSNAPAGIAGITESSVMADADTGCVPCKFTS